MLIDWFTVIAQIINFLILVYLLKRFLYKPILNAIDEREQRITDQLEDAAQKKEEAREEREEYEQLRDDLDQKKEDMMEEARKNAEEERQEMLEKAKKEYAKLRKNLKESLQSERTETDLELRHRTQEEVFAIARKMLTDLAGTKLESQIIKVFLEKLDNLSEEEIQQLQDALSNGRLRVRSAFDLSSKEKETVSKAVKKLLDKDTQLEYTTAPDEVGGIELVAEGYEIAWTINEYLHSLEERIIALNESENTDHASEKA